MRISRRLRGFIAAAVTTGALLVLPGAAVAAPIWTTSSLTSTGPYVSGATATYTLDIVNTGDAVGGTAGTIELTEDFSAVTIVGTPTVADGPGAGADMSAQLTVAAGSNEITVLNAFGAGDARVTFVVQLPNRFESSFAVEADGAPDPGAPFSETDSAQTVSKGTGSDLDFAFHPDAAKFVAKDGTYTSSLTVTNTGTGAAEFARVNFYNFESASEFSPDWGGAPAFNTVVTMTGGCPTVEDSWTCLLGTVAPGQSHTIIFTVTALTHYGNVSVGAYGTTAQSSSTNGGDQIGFDVTNGKTAALRVDVTGPEVGAGNADVTFSGEFVNAGPDAIDAGILAINATGFSPGGTLTESIKSITLSTGGACGNRMNHTVAPETPIKNSWYCAANNIVAGQRVTFTVVANFPTTEKDTFANVSASFQSSTYLSQDGNAFDGQSVTLNPEKTVDLETSLTSTALLGADRVAAVTVTVKNNGTYKAESVEIAGDVYGTGGTFDAATLPASCSGVVKPQFARCGLGTIEAGQSKSLTINVRGGANLGSIAVSFNAFHNGQGFETNSDNNTQSLVLDIVKANTVPFTGVEVAKPKVQSIAQMLASGVPATVTCPVACKVVGQLQVNRGQAEKLGLVKKPRRANPRAPKFIVIGTATKTDADGGQVVIAIKVTRAYKAKLAKLAKPLTATRALTVTSTDPATMDATFQKSQPVTFKPAKKKKAVRR